MKKVMAWKFVKEDGRGAYGNLAFVPGYIYTTDEAKIVPCVSGIHASEHPFDALHYAPGPVLCRVRMWGEVAYHGDPTDKLAARNCEVLSAVDLSVELRMFGCWCVRQIWDLVTDDRSRNAVEVSERFAIGGAAEEDLCSARSAAEAAAWSAARSAAGSAAWSAARSAAEAAARSAARSAAEASQRAKFCCVVSDAYVRSGR